MTKYFRIIIKANDLEALTTHVKRKSTENTEIRGVKNQVHELVSFKNSQNFESQFSFKTISASANSSGSVTDLLLTVFDDKLFAIDAARMKMS